LNDGLVLPLIIFIACAAVGFDHELARENWYVFAGQQIGFGLGIGAVLGSLGGIASYWSVEKGYAVEENTSIFALTLVGVTYFAADAVGGNSFVAVFASGLCFGRFAKTCAIRAKEFLETDGMLLMMAAFFFIGALMLPAGLEGIDWMIVLAATLSLFIVRPLAVYISMIGTATNLRARLFLGWFGPRGLATALFTLVILGEFGGKLQDDTILSVAMTAFVASTILHGITAHYAGKLWGAGNDA
jgi:NhaP-type Na+/H+ or K+/H+ antiporter